MKAAAGQGGVTPGRTPASHSNFAAYPGPGTLKMVSSGRSPVPLRLVPCETPRPSSPRTRGTFSPEESFSQRTALSPRRTEPLDAAEKRLPRLFLELATKTHLADRRSVQRQHSERRARPGDFSRFSSWDVNRGGQGGLWATLYPRTRHKSPSPSLAWPRDGKNQAENRMQRMQVGGCPLPTFLLGRSVAGAGGRSAGRRD